MRDYRLETWKLETWKFRNLKLGKRGLSTNRASAVAVRLTTELGILKLVFFNHGDTEERINNEQLRITNCEL